MITAPMQHLRTLNVPAYSHLTSLSRRSVHQAITIVETGLDCTCIRLIGSTYAHCKIAEQGKKHVITGIYYPKTCSILTKIDKGKISSAKLMHYALGHFRPIVMLAGKEIHNYIYVNASSDKDTTTVHIGATSAVTVSGTLANTCHTIRQHHCQPDSLQTYYHVYKVFLPVKS